MAYRVTIHNKRIEGARHNDRNFDTSKAEHLHPNKEKLNAYKIICSKDALTFDEAEKDFYTRYFSKAINYQNEKYIKSGHSERCRTIEEYRHSKQTCPEEVLYYFGNKEGHAKAQQLVDCWQEYAKWHHQTFPGIAILDVAVHMDEETPHIHERRVYMATTEHGHIVSQTKCFKEMGIERPEPDKPKSRFNNPKMTYSAVCRNKMIEIAKEHGLEIIEKPREASKSGLKLVDYQKQQTELELSELKQEKAILERQIQSKQAELTEAVNGLSTIEKMLYDMRTQPLRDNHPNRNNGIGRDD